MGYVELTLEHSHFLFDEADKHNCDTRIFDPEYVVAHLQSSTISSHGRGHVLVFSHRGKTLALRQYRRGGWIQHVSADRYLWRGLRQTRGWKEFYLLAQMKRLGLPCPSPYACQAQRSGMAYSASLITELIPHTSTLAQTLQRHELPASMWHKVGKTIRRFHDEGFFHADLNAHNILIDDNDSAFLIDFDRGEKKRPARRWQFANLHRLQRSIKKCWMQADVFYFSPTSWNDLTDGYLNKN